MSSRAVDHLPQRLGAFVIRTIAIFPLDFLGTAMCALGRGRVGGNGGWDCWDSSTARSGQT
eukprot:766514-Hanusia_phi.AAC.6